MIIFDNPSSNIIERLQVGEEAVFSSKSEKDMQPSIVKPSSLNYKISLLEAVVAF